MSEHYRRLSISLPPDLARRLDQAARKRGVPRSKLVQEILAKSLEFKSTTKRIKDPQPETIEEIQQPFEPAQLIKPDTELVEIIEKEFPELSETEVKNAAKRATDFFNLLLATRSGSGAPPGA